MAIVAPEHDAEDQAIRDRAERRTEQTEETDGGDTDGEHDDGGQEVRTENRGAGASRFERDRDWVPEIVEGITEREKRKEPPIRAVMVAVGRAEDARGEEADADAVGRDDRRGHQEDARDERLQP